MSPRHSKLFLRQALPAYKAALDRLGRPFTGLPVMRELCVAEKANVAEERMKSSLERMYHLYNQWGQPGEQYNLSFEELKRERVLLGSPKEVAEQVIAYHREFGAEFIWFRLYWPGMEPEWALETIQLFGREVIPVLKKTMPASRIP